MITPQGTITSLVTPFRENAVDLEALERLIEQQLEAGVDGLVACGTTGEAPTLAPAEHRPVVSLVAKLAKRKALVIAGAGANSTREALDLIHLNEDCGAEALLIVAPYYNRPSQDGLYRHYATLAEATELPIILYNIPVRCGVEIAIPTIKKLFETYDNIVAIKHATGSVLGAADLLAACEIPLLSGDDPLNLPLMSVGGVGVISSVANLFPKSVKRLVDAARSGDPAAVRETHKHLYPISQALLTLETNPIPLKAALAMRGLCAEDLRLPLCPLAEEPRRRLAQLLEGCTLD